MTLVTLAKQYDAKMSEIKEIYFTTSDYNKYSTDTLDAKMEQQQLDLNTKLGT